MLVSTSRTALTRASLAPCVCKRFAHKLVEVELVRDVDALGLQGTRHIVSPGRARNMLIPRGDARYVVRGEAVSPLNSMLDKLSGAISRRPSPSQSVAGSKANQAETIDPLAAQRALESDLFASVSLLPTLTFHRRLIAPTASQGAIHGSVSQADVFTAIREFGIVLEESASLSGGFKAVEGVEKGRVKGTGVYEFELAFRTIGETSIIKVDVAKEE